MPTNLRSSATRLQSVCGDVDGLPLLLLLVVVDDDDLAARRGAQVSLLNISKHASYSASVAVTIVDDNASNVISIVSNHTRHPCCLRFIPRTDGVPRQQQGDLNG
jgi:hypothetical protein